MRLKPPRIIRRIYPDLVWEIEDSSSIFLTFDDGPTPGITEWILSTLRKYNAKATFFVLGKNVEMYPDLYELILAEGHKIGNHTYSHQKGWGMSLERYVEDVDFANDTLNTDLFRPPYGQITPSQSRLLGQRFKLIMWSIISRDYNPRLSPKRCYNNVAKYLEAGSIVVFHDSEKSFKNMSYALPRVLKLAKEKGLECRVIDI
ncbi:MAG: polysaccharide deacetylase family protein [Rikenellaceae bacterium]